MRTTKLHYILTNKNSHYLPCLYKKYIILLTGMLFFICKVFNQQEIPVTPLDVAAYNHYIEHQKASGLRSKTTWKNDMQSGNLLLGKRRKTQTEFFGKSGLLLELEYYNEQGKKDSIATFQNKGINLVEYNLFTPMGEVLKKKVFKYYPDGSVQRIFHYIGSANIETKSYYFHDKNSGNIIQSDYTKNDSLVHKTIYEPGKDGLEKIIYEDGIGNKEYEKVFIYNEGKLMEELFYFPAKENNYKNKFKYDLRGKVSEIKKENAEQIVTSTIIKKYDEHGKISGMAFYEGDVIFHSEIREKFDVLNNEVKASDKKIILLMQYTYQFY